MGLSTHILDTTRGRPAAGVHIDLALRGEDGNWSAIGSGHTNEDGRLATLLPAAQPFVRGTYKITFDVGDYFERLGTTAFYPEVSIVFEVTNPTEHYHVPLLLNPFGYATYRGS